MSDRTGNTMHPKLAKLQDRLKTDGAKTWGAFEALDEAGWRQQVYTTGSKWGARQILAHFVSAEREFNRLIEDVLQGGPGAGRDFDIDAFNEDRTPPLSLKPIEELLQAFQQVRADTVALCARLKASDLQRRGYHPWFGEIELESMLKLIYRHNMIHLRDLRKALDQGTPVAHLDLDPPARKETGP